MLRDITIGQYVDTGSVIHKLDPRTKILLLAVYLVLIFAVFSPLAYVVIFAATAAVTALSRVPLKFILRGLKPMLFILIFTMVLNLFVTPGEPIWSLRVTSFWTVNLTQEGINMAVLMFFRLLFLVVASSLLTLTTSPMSLTDGIEKLLKPFEVIKVPAHEIAMMMTIAIRFIPTLAEEADKIMKAQTARGADFESGNMIERVKAMLPLLVPLFVSAFRRADDLAVAMDARCYHGGKNRTRMNEIKAGKKDAAAVFLMVIFIAILFTAEHFGKML